jgi:hypothetical protein
VLSGSTSGGGIGPGVSRIGFERLLVFVLVVAWDCAGVVCFDSVVVVFFNGIFLS